MKLRRVLSLSIALAVSAVLHAEIPTPPGEVYRSDIEPGQRRAFFGELHLHTNLQTGTYQNSIGAAVLTGVWRDPEFDPKRPAVYYARALEIPTPRCHEIQMSGRSIFDANFLG